MVIAGAPPDPVGGAAAREAARAELRHREYHRDDPGLVSRFLHWVGRQIGALFTGGGGAHALLVVLLIVLAVIVIFAVRAGAPTRHVRNASEDLDPLAPVAARDHRRIAEQLTAEGRRAEAVREWLRATVASIEERGVLPPRPGRTGAATAREAGPLLPAVAADLHAATTAFDEVWFGGREARDTDVAVARAAADGVATARVAGSAAAPAGIAVPW